MPLSLWQKKKKPTVKTKVLFPTFIFLLIAGCSQESKPIEFGQDGCSYCKMTIVDDKYAAEMVTKKGKVYKFDSIECMVRSLSTGAHETSKFYVMDFANPGTFIEAKTATFLINESIPSPMGANLSAFKTEQIASKYGVGGTLYDWNSLRNHIN